MRYRLALQKTLVRRIEYGPTRPRQPRRHTGDFGQAMIEKRTRRTLGFVNGVWNGFLVDEPMHGFDGPFGETAQFLGEYHLSATLAARVENGPSGNVQPKHFFQTQGLRAKLGIVVIKFAAAALFELDGKQRTVGMAFDDVAPATEPEPIRPNGQRTQQRHAPDRFVTGNIGLIVDTIADYGVLIGPAPPLNGFQRRPARTKQVVVDERKGNGIGW